MQPGPRGQQSGQPGAAIFVGLAAAVPMWSPSNRLRRSATLSLFAVSDGYALDRTLSHRRRRRPDGPAHVVVALTERLLKSAATGYRPPVVLRRADLRGSNAAVAVVCCST